MGPDLIHLAIGSVAAAHSAAAAGIAAGRMPAGPVITVDRRRCTVDRRLAGDAT
jgi:hypothetical protein